MFNKLEQVGPQKAAQGIKVAPSKAQWPHASKRGEKSHKQVSVERVPIAVTSADAHGGKHCRGQKHGETFTQNTNIFNMGESTVVGTPGHVSHVWLIVYMLESIQSGRTPPTGSKSLEAFISSLYTHPFWR